MKPIKCILCDSLNTYVLEDNVNKQKQENFKVFRCSNCDISFSDPMKPLEDYSSEITHERWEFSKLINYLKGFKDTGKLNVLEVGCGDGRFLYKVSKLGCSCYGLDINPNGIKKAHMHGLTNTICSTLNNDFTKRYSMFFNIVFSFHVLEHVENPKKTVHYLRDILKKDGLLFLSVPNPDRLSAKIFKEDWDIPPYHLTKWSNKSLSYLMENQGFEIIEFIEEPLTFESAYIYIVNTYYFIAKLLKKISIININNMKNKKGIKIKKLLHIVSIPASFFLGSILSFLSAIKILPNNLNKGLSLVVVARKLT